MTTTSAATSAAPATASTHKKSNTGTIAGIVIGCVAALVLIPALAFYIRRRVHLRRTHHRHAQGNLTAAETATGAYDSSQEPKGAVELASPAAMPVNERHEMESPLMSNYTHSGSNELQGAEQHPIELPAESIQYNK